MFIDTIWFEILISVSITYYIFVYHISPKPEDDLFYEWDFGKVLVLLFFSFWFWLLFIKANLLSPVIRLFL